MRVSSDGDDDSDDSRIMQRPADVLLLDDADPDAEVTIFAIRRARPDATVVRLKDGEQALQFVFRTGAYALRPEGPPGLILLELNLPIVGALDVIDQLQGTTVTARIPVVLITRTLNPLVIERAFALGARSFILKVADFDKYCAEIAAAVARWLPAE